ncbi:MAG TPA: PAC2 family protein [Candidatus Angelobacter sp.]|nr:PAC2 family protein [Candidatus Angelobacter sp.]
MTLYELTDRSPLDAPVLIAALEGWVDAGAAGTAAAEQIAEGGRTVATFDADAIFDYRARRPTLDILDGRPTHLAWPTLRVVAARAGERDLLVLTGPEPDYRWRELADSMVALVRELGVASWVSLGAIPAAVPHTRPVPVLATASEDGLLPDGIRQGPDGRLTVPSAALSVFELTAANAGIPAVGLFAQVPHYVSGAYPTASIALLNALGRHLGVDFPVGQLATRALERRGLLDAAAASDESTKAHVERLERIADESGLPAGDELIADIERFLRGTTDDDEGSDGGTRLH